MDNNIFKIVRESTREKGCVNSMKNSKGIPLNQTWMQAHMIRSDATRSNQRAKTSMVSSNMIRRRREKLINFHLNLFLKTQMKLNDVVVGSLLKFKNIIDYSTFQIL